MRLTVSNASGEASASGIEIVNFFSTAAINGTRQGINDYTGWFAGDKDMAGNYFGYDGPCPPWNDEILHHYVFTVYALDVPRLDIAGDFGIGPGGGNGNIQPRFVNQGELRKSAGGGTSPLRFAFSAAESNALLFLAS